MMHIAGTRTTANKQTAKSNIWGEDSHVKVLELNARQNFAYFFQDLKLTSRRILSDIVTK
jgi:hypothetical protein